MNNEKIKEYIKTNKCEKYYYKGLTERTIEQKYQYIKTHFQYDIMNSWNKLKSFANNVKIYKMGLTNEQQNKFFELMQIDSDFLYYESICIIEEFEKLTNTQVYFNGRSGGYMVIVPDFNICKRNEHLLNYYNLENIKYCDNYKEFKIEQSINSYFSYKDSYKGDIDNVYYILKAFDKLCDILRNELIYILDNYTIEEHEETYTKAVKEIII